MDPVQRAVAQIARAPLTDRLRAIATALLAMQLQGHVTLSWPQLQQMLSVSHKGAIWQYLGQLEKAGILICGSTSNFVHIKFSAWLVPQPDATTYRQSA